MTPPPQDVVFGAMDEDYPKTVLELERRFCTEEARVEFLAALRPFFLGRIPGAAYPASSTKTRVGLRMNMNEPLASMAISTRPR